VGDPRSQEQVPRPSAHALSESDWESLCAKARVYLAAGAWQSTHELLWPRFAPWSTEPRIPFEAVQCLCLLMAAWFRLKQAGDLARGCAWLRALEPRFAELDDETRALAEHALALEDVRAGRYDEARQRLAVLTPEMLLRVTPWVRARIALMLGRIDAVAGRQTDAEQYGLEAARAAGLAGSETLRGDAVALLAIIARRRGALAEANVLYAQAATHYWQSGNISGHTTVLLNRAWALGVIGLLTHSRRLFQEVLLQSGSLNRPTTALRAKLGLGWIAVRGGDPEAARGRLLAVWREARRLGMPREEGLALGYLADAYTLTGSWPQAKAALGLAERWAARLGPEGDLALEAGVRRATFLLARGDLVAAEERARTVIARAEQMSMPWESAQALRITGIAAFRAGRLADAGAAFAQARTVLDGMGERLELRAVEAWIGALERLHERAAQDESAGSPADGRADGAGLRAEVAANRARDAGDDWDAAGEGTDSARTRAVRFWLRHPLLGPLSWLNDGAAGSTASEPATPSARLAREHPSRPSRTDRTAGVTRADLNPVWAELGLVTRSPQLVQTLKLAETYAPGRIPVLILGETGTGKDLLAQGLGRLAGRKGRLVPVNCASAQKDLFVAELFGARRGAYTGAVERRRGLIEEAEGGTIFFDEIADLAPEAQGFLLRFLDSGEVRALGETRSRRIETRVVAATCRDLHAMVRQGQFRPDLHARLAGLVLRLPPLRERPEDFDLLVEMLWQREGGAAAACRLVFAPELQADLQQLPWPGNVRELRHAVSRALLYARIHGDRAARVAPEQWLRGIGVDTQKLPEFQRLPERRQPEATGGPAEPGGAGAARMPAEPGGAGAAEGAAAHGPAGHSPAQDRRSGSGGWSRAQLESALTSSGGRIAGAAKLLGLSRSHAYRLYKQLHDDNEAERTDPESRAAG
jgi:transcriptional regulator with GAF, ATPase, and Fis domain